jgi:hypothetical protein
MADLGDSQGGPDTTSNLGGRDSIPSQTNTQGLKIPEDNNYHSKLFLKENLDFPFPNPSPPKNNMVHVL